MDETYRKIENKNQKCLEINCSIFSLFQNAYDCGRQQLVEKLVSSQGTKNKDGGVLDLNGTSNILQDSENIMEEGEKRM